MVRIVIADDHALLRVGVRRLIEAQGGFEVVGEAATGEQAIQLLRRHSPDILLLDLSMPGGDGFDVLREARRRHPATSVVVVTAHEDDHHRRYALEEGARVVLGKSVAPGAIVDTLEQVAAGDATAQPVPKPNSVSSREFQVLVPLAAGKTHREIAAELGITVKTVDTHRRKILKKLGLRNNAELTRYAVRQGLLEA